MKITAGSTQQALVGQEGRIVLGERRMTFLSPTGAPATARAAAGYEEVAEVSCKGRRLTVAFKTPGPSWTLTAGSPEEAAWAAEFIELRRQAAALDALPAGALTLPVFAERLGELLSQAAPNVPAAAAFLVRGAAALGASDIHINPGDPASVTVRLAGHVHTVCQLSAPVCQALISRLKALAGLPSYVADRPMSGLISLSTQPPAEARLTTVPALGGEAAAIRVISPATQPRTVDDLGLEKEQMPVLLSAVREAGLTVFTGPAGAGKTTTMYALLRHAAAGARRAVSVEHPPESSIEEVLQIDVEDVGERWDAAVLAALRLDPEVIAIGEIHDEPTARIAVRSALAGHSLLTTLHAGSTAEVPVRLLQLGVEPYALASALRLLVAQRLVRTVCDKCAEPYQPDEQVLSALGLSASDISTWRLKRGRGCEACGGTGYAGRTACFELWQVDEAVRRLILDRASAEAFEKLRREQGIKSPLDAALAKAARGLTTLEEIARVFAGGMEGA